MSSFTIGNSVKLTIQFLNRNDGITPIDVSNVSLKIYDSNQVQIGTTVSITNVYKLDTGLYFYNLVIPNNPPYIDIEWSATNDGLTDLSRDRIEIAWYEEDIDQDIIDDPSAINLANIKALLNITLPDYDTRIQSLILPTITKLCDYCNDDFIAKNRTERIYESTTLTINKTITQTSTIPFKEHDFFRISGTTYNDGLYQIKSIVGNVITTTSGNKLRTETTTAYIALVEFPQPFLEVISNYMMNNIINSSNVSKEKIGDVEVTYGTTSTGFGSDNSILNQYRNVYYHRWYRYDRY